MKDYKIEFMDDSFEIISVNNETTDAKIWAIAQNIANDYNIIVCSIDEIDKNNEIIRNLY